MAKRGSDNIEMLLRVVRRLAPLLNRFVFLGGAVTELLMSETGAPGARQTKDVDLVVDVVDRGEYSESLREQLVALGLSEDTRPGAPICRWALDDMIIDIMPTRGDILGFSCEWYQVAYDSALPYRLPDGTSIRLVTPACFLATKLAAFNDRGRHDPHARRGEIVADLAAAPPDLRAYVADRLSQLLARTDASIPIAAHLMPDSASQDRLPIVVDRIRGLISAAAAH